MTAPQLDATAGHAFRPTSGFEWWDPDAECTLVVSSPLADPDLWKDYLTGAERSYRSIE